MAIDPSIINELQTARVANEQVRTQQKQQASNQALQSAEIQNYRAEADARMAAARKAAGASAADQQLFQDVMQETGGDPALIYGALMKRGRVREAQEWQKGLDAHLEAQHKLAPPPQAPRYMNVPGVGLVEIGGTPPASQGVTPSWQPNPQDAQGDAPQPSGQLPSGVRVLMPTPPTAPGGAQGFTLSPGQKRYDATGKEIAGVPDRPKAAGEALPSWANQPITPLPVGERDESFLKTLPAAQQNQVKALVEGRMAFPTGAALRSTYWQSLLGAVARYDPSFDTVNYNSRSKTRSDFTSGASAKQINALNTVVGHMSSLIDAADALNNGNVQYFNSAKNWLKTSLGDSSVPKFETVKKAVSDELTRVWRQSGGAEADIQAWQASLSASNSPAQLHAVVSQIGDLLESKLTSLQDQYRQGMGTDKISVITPEASKTLDRLRGRTTAASAAPAAGTIRARDPQGKLHEAAAGTPLPAGWTLEK